MKDYRMGEEICACIRLKSGETTTEEEIKAFCKGKVGVSAPPISPTLECSHTYLSLPTIQDWGMPCPGHDSAAK